MSTEPRPGWPRTDILVVPLSDADGRPAAPSEAHVIRAVPDPAPQAPSGPAAPAPDIRTPRPAPAPRPAAPDPVAPSEYRAPSGLFYDEPSIVWHRIGRTPAASPSRTRAPEPTPIRTVLIVVGASAAGLGAAGFAAGLLSSTLPFQILGWGAVGGGVLVLVVRAARWVAGHIPGRSGP